MTCIRAGAAADIDTPAPSKAKKVEPMNAERSRHLVDPALLPFLEALPTIDFSEELLPAIRSRPAWLPVNPEDAARTLREVRPVKGPEGAPDVDLHIIRPKDAQGPLPAILHIHGGGYVVGDAAGMEQMHRRAVQELNCVIVSVDYRLAPETVYPGAVEDCYAGLAYVMTEAEALGIDRSRVGVMGESAGGGLAAALALLARDRGFYALAFQHLIYPMLDDRTGTHGDPHPFAGEYIWTPHNNRFGWGALLGRPPGGEGVSPYAAPARAESLKGLPPTFISTGSLDLFLEEDMEYARRLIRDGVATEFHIYPGGPHAFDMAPGVAIAETARRDSQAALLRAFKG
jgi:triacylglycerol lipase